MRIKDITCKNNLKFHQLKLSNIEKRNISDEIIKYLTTHNEIINEFLGELESIKTDEFNEFYEYLCLELKSDNLFAKSFNYYLRWLIGHIHNIVSGKYKWRELSHFNRIIGSKLAQLINVEVDFEKIKEIKEKVQNTVEIAHENPVNPEVNELSAEIKNDNFELLKERYKQETGRRAIYAGKETKSFKGWIESLNETQDIQWGSGRFEDIGIKKKITNRNSFSTFEFLKQLKIKVESIVGYSIRQDVFSKEYLGRSKGHYEYIISKSKSTPDYKILKLLLLDYEKQLKIKLGSKFEKTVTLFERYRNSNLLFTKKYRIFKFHPNLNINYFQIINTVEKAYWFGFLLADGSILIQKGNKVLSIELNVNDGILLKNLIRAIGFNPLYVKYYKRIYHNDKGERKIKRTFRVRFTNDDFVNNMINKGFILGDKADKITFPSFTDPEFQLACLLGFFDGDGSHVGTPTIYSKSRDFLESVVKVLKIRGYNKTFEIKPKRKNGKIEVYYLGLGAELFNDMLNVYQNSLPRKRKKYLVGDELKKRRRENWSKHLSNYKKEPLFKFSKKELIILRNEKKLTYKDIAKLHQKKFGVKISLHTVRYWCLKWNLKNN